MSEEIRRILTFRPADQAALRQADPNEVAATFDELLTENAKETYVDGDGLISLGRKLRLAEQGALESRVEAWLKQQPTPKRIEVATSFLTGYWRTKHPVSESLTTLVIDRLSMCEAEKTLLATALLALCQVPFTGASEELKARAREVLSAYIARVDTLHLEPGLVEQMSDAVK